MNWVRFLALEEPVSMYLIATHFPPGPYLFRNYWVLQLVNFEISISVAFMEFYISFSEFYFRNWIWDEFNESNIWVHCSLQRHSLNELFNLLQIIPFRDKTSILSWQRYNFKRQNFVITIRAVDELNKEKSLNTVPNLVLIDSLRSRIDIIIVYWFKI